MRDNRLQRVMYLLEHLEKPGQLARRPQLLDWINQQLDAAARNASDQTIGDESMREILRKGLARQDCESSFPAWPASGSSDL